MGSGTVQIYFAYYLNNKDYFQFYLPIYSWLSKQNPEYMLCFYMLYMYLSGSPGFSYFETKNVKIINNFLISETQLSLLVYMAYFSMLLLSVVSRSRTMWWVGSCGLHGWKGKFIQVSGKKNMKEREHFEDLRIDRINTVSSAITSDLLTQIGYNMIDGHGMKTTTCLQPVLRLRM